MDTRLYVYFQISVFAFFAYTQGMELLDHMLVLFSVFWRTFLLFPIMAAPIYTPTDVVRSPLFSTSLPTFVIGGLFDDNHSHKCKVISHFGFDLYFSHDSWSWAAFHVLVGQLYVFVGKISIQVLCSFLTRLFVLLILSGKSRWYILVLTLIHHIICKYFLPFRRMIFHFVGSFMCKDKADEVSSVYF